jgi:hypothetical protein
MQRAAVRPYVRFLALVTRAVVCHTCNWPGDWETRPCNSPCEYRQGVDSTRQFPRRAPGARLKAGMQPAPPHTHIYNRPRITRFMPPTLCGKAAPPSRPGPNPKRSGPRIALTQTSQPPLPMSPVKGNSAAAHSRAPPFFCSASISRRMLHPLRVRVKGVPPAPASN